MNRALDVDARGDPPPRRDARRRHGEATVEDVLPGEAAVARGGARARSTGSARGPARVWPFLGPAFIAAVAYIDPGNFATNIAGGAKFGYLLLWVSSAANLIAMLVQTQSAKLGIATGKNLSELCRETVPAPRLDRHVDAGRGRGDVHATWPRSWARRSASTCCSASRSSRRA